VSQALHPVLHRITLSGDDFGRAAGFAKAAQSHPVSSIEYEALVHNAILFYARPWLDNEERKSKLPKDARMLTGMQGREFTPGCRPVSLTRQLHGEQTVVFFFYHRIALATASF
jgi:hypothetical protein